MGDDKSIGKTIQATCSAGLQQRNFVVMEMHANLLKDHRAKAITAFDDFKKVALVISGEPPASFKKMTQTAILKEKQDVSDAEHQKKLDAQKAKQDAIQKVKDQAKEKKRKEKEA